MAVFLRAAAIGLTLTSSTLAAAPSTVVDGDTVELAGERIRIANIDAPEVRTAQARRRVAARPAAKARLEQLLGAGIVVIERGDPPVAPQIDRWGRTPARITVDGRDVGDFLIEERRRALEG